MGSVVLQPGVSAWFKGAVVVDPASGVSSGYGVRIAGTAYISGNLTSAGTIAGRIKIPLSAPASPADGEIWLA